ncbi:hypothetical protein [Bradyrhizobium sp. 23AC]
MRKPGRRAVLGADIDGNARKIEEHLDGGGSFRNCPVSQHFRSIVKHERPTVWISMLKKSKENERERKIELSRRKMMARTVCANGHPLTPENTAIKVVRIRQGKRGRWLARQCLTCRYASMKKSSYTAEEVKAAIQGAQAGFTMAQLTSYRHPNTRVIRQNQLMTAMQDKPKLASVLRPLFARNRATNHKALMQRLSPRGIFSPSSDVILRAVEAVVPHTLGYHQRQEIVGEMVFAVMEGRLDLKDLRTRYSEFARAADRMFPTKFAPPSLDAPAFRDGEIPLIETISRSLWI